MTAIRHSLQQELFKPIDEALYSVVNVTKTGGGKKKKNSFLCAAVTKAKPFQVRIYKVQKSEKEVFKKKHCWQLNDLKTVDGINEKQDTLDFDLHFEKVYHWTASRLADRNDFIVTLFTLGNRYSPAKQPDFVNVNQQILELDPTNKIISSVKGTSNEGSEDYQKLTPKEEMDINARLAEFEDALTNVEAFAEQLSSELQELEYVNITSLMGSEQQAKDLLGLIDDSVEKLAVLDKRLTNYDEYLQKVSDQMGQMEFKDNRMEIQRKNNKKLLEEIKYIVGRLDVSQRHVTALQEGDLYNQLGIEECISASKILHDAVNTPFKAGISELHAVREQIGRIENYKAQFAQRFYTHLDKFISQHSNIETINYKPTNDMVLPSHDVVHSDFIPYVELMKWLKDLDNENYSAIKTHHVTDIFGQDSKIEDSLPARGSEFYKIAMDRAQEQINKMITSTLCYIDSVDKDDDRFLKELEHYQEQFSATYAKEFGQYMDFCRMRAAMKVKDPKSSPKIGGLRDQVKTGSRLNISRLKNKGKMKRSGSRESISSMASIESSTSSMVGGGTASATHFDQVFDIILSELEPYVSSEQDFCAQFFHLHYPGEDKEDKADGTDAPDGLAFSRPSERTLNPETRNVVDEVRDMMKKIYGFLDLELQSFISFGESLHPHNILYCMSRIQNQSSHLVTSYTTSTPPTFLGTLFGGWLVYTKRLFDKYIDNLCRQISDVKVQKKKKHGLLPDVTTVEQFFKASENIFRGSERRGEIDKAYKTIIKILMVKIEEVAEENDKPPPEIVMFENYHYLHSIIRSLKNQSLENEKAAAETAYYDAMTQYIATRLGRPLDRLSRFFQSVESCINSGVRMEDIGYQLALNQQELKNVIKEYPSKEVKKGLDVLYKKMEKYVTEAGLKQVLWHNLQEAFVRQYERYQELVDSCYPNSNIELPVSINDILEFFSSIAISH